MLGSKKSLIASAIATVLCLILYFFVPFEGLEQQGKGCLIVLIWAIIMWIARPIPEYITAILSAAIVLIVFKVKGSAATAGFSNTGWWLTVWATFLGGAMAVSGLGYRLAWTILAKLGRTQLGVSYATNIASNILGALIPSNTARGSVMSTICDNISNAMGHEPGEYKGDHGLMLSNLYTNCTNTWLYYTGTGANAIAMGIVFDALGKGVTWMGWLKATCVPALAVLMIIPWLCYKLFPPANKKETISPDFAKEKLAELGPISYREKAALVITCLTILLWMTEKIHGIGTNNVAFLMAVALLFPKIGVCTYKEISNRVPWPQLIWLGFAMSLAGVVNSTGGFEWIVKYFIIDSGIISGMSFFQLMLLWLPMVVFMHIIFAGMNAMVTILIPISITVANAMGFDPYITALLTTMAISAGAFFMPYNSAPNLIFYGTGRFTINHQLKGAVPIAILIVIGFIFSLTVWWPLVGII